MTRYGEDGPTCHPCGQTEARCAHTYPCCSRCGHTFGAEPPALTKLVTCRDCGSRFAVPLVCGPSRTLCHDCRMCPVYDCVKPRHRTPAGHDAVRCIDHMRQRARRYSVILGEYA